MSGHAAHGVVFAVSALATLIATGVWRRVAIDRNLVHAPGGRRSHTVATPTLGGAGMLVGFLAGMGVAWAMPAFGDVFGASTEPLGLTLAVLVMHAVGAVDEVRKSPAGPAYLHDGLSAPAKTAGMVLAASIMSLAGITILHFRVPFGDALGLGDLFVLSPDLSFLVTVVWVLGMATAINYIDGLDGLAAGIVFIAAVAFYFYSDLLASEGLIAAGNVGPMVAAIVAGMCAGFLPWNVHPAKIFMGDNGALMLGLLMAAATISVGGRSDDPFSGQAYFFYAPLFIPVLILGVPILDAAFSIVRRAAKGASPAAADKDHLHHRLVRLGHGQWRSVLILWGWTALLSGFVLYPAITGQGNAIVPFGIGALALALYTLFHPGARQARKGVAIPVGDSVDSGD